MAASLPASLLPLRLSCTVSPCLPWDVESCSTHIPYVDSGVKKARGGVAADWC